MTAKFRTLLGISLFIPLAAILLATFACLPVPVGDPETSKVDPQYTGAYKAVSKDATDTSTIVALLQPWDGKTYFLQYIMLEKKDGKDNPQLLHFKAWLTKIGDATFLTAQPMDNLSYAVGNMDSKPYWSVFRLDKVDGGFEARMVSQESEFIKGLTKREEVEAAIKAHVSDQALYGENLLTFKKLSKEDKAFLDETLAKFGYTDLTMVK